MEELFEQIMSMSRKLQYQLLAAHGSEGRLPFIGVDELETECARVVYQGAEGSYSQAAMRKFFGENVNAFHVESFRDAMSAIDEGSADFAVLPIEIPRRALSMKSTICWWNSKTTSWESR